jgi:glucokinase
MMKQAETRGEMAGVSDLWLRRILRVLFERRQASRGEIARATGLGAAGVDRALRQLIQYGLVRRLAPARSASGRRRDELALQAEAGYFVAVDLEGTRVRFGLTNLLAEVLYRWEEPVAFGSRFEMRTFARGVEKVLRNLTPDEQARVIAMGVSYSGVIDREGRITAVNLGWKDFPLEQEIACVVDLPFFLGSESFVKLMAEHWQGAARSSGNCFFVHVANGVGFAGLVNGHLMRGRDGNAGEIGHITVDPAAPDRCKCGKTGCLEAIASSPNIVRQYRELTGQSLPKVLLGEQVMEVFHRARSQDPAALAVIDRAAGYLGLALAHAANLLNPEVIVLGGDLLYAQDLFLPRIRAELARHVLPEIYASLEVRFSALGFDSGLIGAACLAFHEALRDPVLLARMFSASRRRDAAATLTPAAARQPRTARA